MSVMGGRNRPGLSRQSSGVRLGGSPAPPSSNSKHLPKEEGHVEVGGLNPPNYKLDSVQAGQLIAFVYESKLKDALEDHSAINFFECEPLLEYAKDVSGKDRYNV